MSTPLSQARILSDGDNPAVSRYGSTPEAGRILPAVSGILPKTPLEVVAQADSFDIFENSLVIHTDFV
jgi:hypothetical protein